MKLIEQDEMHAFRAVLAKARLPVGDFDLCEVDTTDPKTDEIEALKGFVRITRKSTGQKREYPTGDGSKWVEEFERDLEEKLFD
jgi:DNA-directed RNA polymerase subunit H (RpoH/RPB5)